MTYGSPRGSVFSLMKTNPVPLRVRNKGEPANPGFYRLLQNPNFPRAAGRDSFMDVLNRQRQGGSSLPIPVWPFTRTIEAKCYRRGSELGPEVVPFAAAFQAEQLLVKLARSSHIPRAIHDKIYGADGDRRPLARWLPAADDTFGWHLRKKLRVEG